MNTRMHDPARQAPTLIRWGPVFAGAVVGLAIMLLLSSLWVAIGQGTGVEGVANNLHWFGLVSVIVALFVAAYLAGWLGGSRGWGPGLVNGLTVWALILVGTLLIGVPSALRIFDAAAGPVQELADAPLWATFWSLLGGLVVAVIGGAMGGSAPRPSWLYAPAASHEPEPVDHGRAEAAYEQRVPSNATR